MMCKKKIYTVSTANLDTFGYLPIEETISKYIYKIVVDNIALLKKYKSYVFSLQGAYRYELLEEYYPALFNKVKEYIENNKWSVAGSSYENGDVNIPSPEALFRNILYANEYFKEKFNKTSVDLFLPDALGLGWALPSIASHANLKGITTRNLTCDSSCAVAFDIGKWYGVDSNYVYANVNPANEVKSLSKIRNLKSVSTKLNNNEQYGLECTCVFEGVGGKNGSTCKSSAKCLNKEVSKNKTNDVDVISAHSDEIFRELDNTLTQGQKDNLPSFNNELVMKKHGVGSYTSRAISKRWNRRCEELADMAERNCVVAEYLGVSTYNQYALDKAWKRVIAHQFYDDIAGTACQDTYLRSWNDYGLSMNQFSSEIESSLASISTLLTSNFCKGVPVMVANSFEFDRTQAVTIRLSNIDSEFVRIFDYNAQEVKSQVNFKKDGIIEIVFIADVKAMGYKVYDVVPSDEPCQLENELSIDSNTMQNQRYSVALNDNGDIVSIIDKTLKDRELLDENIVLGLYQDNGSKLWPAWEIEYNEINKKEDAIPNLIEIKIVENGAARVTFKIEQNYNNSTFINYVSLSDGSRIVEIRSQIEWKEMRTLAKQKFSFTAKSEQATFDLGLGAIKRGNMNANLYEVPCQKWADITDESGEFGVSVISECKYAWDKFNDNTLRMTVLHTPKYDYNHQSKQSMLDLGLNRYSYAIFSHEGSVGVQTQKEARSFIQPMCAVRLDKHSGKLGSEFSFVETNNQDIIIRAMKKAHNGDIIIVRLNEGTGKSVEDYKLTLGSGIVQAVELYASEEFKGVATVKNGSLVTSFKPYEIKTFALALRDNKLYNVSKSKSYKVKVMFDKNIISKKHYLNNDFEYFIPQSLIPDKITACGTEFSIDSKSNNALVPDREVFELKHRSNEVKILCTSFDGDKDVEFLVDDRKVTKRINDAFQNYATWDMYDYAQTAYIKDGCLGYEATHCIDQKGKDIIAKNMYFWVITLDTTNALTITLPKDKNIAILGINEILNSPKAKLVTELYDSVSEREFNYTKEK